MTGNFALLLTIYSLWIVAGLVAFGWEFTRRWRSGTKADVGASMQRDEPFTDARASGRDQIELTLGPSLRAHEARATTADLSITRRNPGSSYSRGVTGCPAWP